VKRKSHNNGKHKTFIDIFKEVTSRKERNRISNESWKVIENISKAREAIISSKANLPKMVSEMR